MFSLRVTNNFQKCSVSMFKVLPKAIPVYQTTWDHNPGDHNLNTLTPTTSNTMHFVYYYIYVCVCVFIYIHVKVKTFYKINLYL